MIKINDEEEEKRKCEKRYQYQPKLIPEIKLRTNCWDLQIQTERKMKRNTPDIVVKDYERTTWLFIDMSLITCKSKNISHYEDLESKIENICL